MRKKILFGNFLYVLASFLVSVAYAGSSYTGTIKAIVCHEENTSDICQIMVNGSVSNETCSTDVAWKYNFVGTTPEGKNLLSILLAAQVAGKNVVLGGKNCPSTNGPENLRHAYISTPQ